MKTTYLLANMALGLTLSTSANAVVIAAWDFNNGFADADEAVQITHAASAGTGTIYQQRADTDGNGKGGQAYTGNGLTHTDGKSMAWDDVSKSGDNDAEFFAVFSTLGFVDINIRFDIEGNVDDGIVSYDLKYSNTTLADVAYNMGTIKDFAGGVSTRIDPNNAPLDAAINTPAFREVIRDLSSVTALNNQNYVAIRFDDFQDNDEMSIDNIVITGTAVPEPSSCLLFGLGALALTLRRKK